MAARTTKQARPDRRDGRGAARHGRDVSSDDSVNNQKLVAGQRVDVPVLAEQIQVEKRTVETGSVVVNVEPTVERQELEVELLEEAVEVERVPVNRLVDGPVSVRQEGDVTIVPVFEEVLVVEKKLMLKEEIRLVRRKVATRERRQFDVRKEQVQVLRADAPADRGTPVAKTAGPADGGLSNAPRGEAP